ncbi:hypothetical protein [Streptomyces sp. SID9124]|uniref:hypothetical protein n=1 Tax=Streptomyces sp. SID9124 TaxID=2706108 RepID=UPI001943808B|nr:hypothetical protein [Streptomyces sp. SID9124]
MGGERLRVVGVVPWGVAAGAVAWCLAGCARAARTDGYPWNAWTPIGYGAVRGVFLGLLAGWCAVLGVRLVRGSCAAARAGGLFAGGLLGGLVPGSLRDFLGPPQPRTLYYFDGPRPASQWYWRPLLSEWLVHTVLPALGCAVLLTVCALLCSRSSRRESVRWAVTAPVGLGLLVLPHYAAAGLPAPEGNGDHVNESATAGMAVAATGLALLAAAWIAWSRRHRSGGRGARTTA